MNVQKKKTFLYLQIRNQIILFLMILGTSTDFNVLRNASSQNTPLGGLLLIPHFLNGYGWTSGINQEESTTFTFKFAKRIAEANSDSCLNIRNLALFHALAR